MIWNSVNITWNELNEFWKLVQEISNEVGGIDAYKLQNLEQKKKKKLVHLVMHIKGVKVYDEKKEIKNITHKLEDIKLIAEEIEKNVQIIYG